MHNEDEEPIPEELVRAFERCYKYPQEKNGVLMLAQGLARASERYKVPMSDIVLRCSELSEYCPTDAHFFDAARLIHEEQQRAAKDRRESQRQQWEREYGPPAEIKLNRTYIVNQPSHWAHGLTWDEFARQSSQRQIDMLDRVMKHLGVKDLAKTSLHQKYVAMQALGYELTSEQRRYL